ncbi:hypothetical protein DL546_000689 [Coniochaeta pulveracea]|uniref:Major facilitator superfamily (MFS) profile domain-containing protein n=1 Tax=Coniochaeta pulveracea TaxID=177199 RepID=A0A420XVR4_9PEZI|nr:hypothetical protein DL546_000689 [Coniochaeta pulveracea]
MKSASETNTEVSCNIVPTDADTEMGRRDVKTNAEILKESWSRRALIVAFVSLFAATFVLSFIKYSTKVYDAYATSAFSKHAALATANVVYTIMNMVTYPVLARLSDVFGRAEGFIFAVLAMALSQVLYASCQNLTTYIVGGIFESVGDTGYTIMQQIFIADTTSLLDRGLWSSLPESVTAIPTLYLGTIVADSVLKHSTWRWGYGMWAIAMPFCAAPLIVSMFVLQRRAKRNGYKVHTAWSRSSGNEPIIRRIYRLLWTDLDLLGAFLLVLGLGLALIPLSLTGSKNSNRWNNGSFIAMLVIGLVIVGVFLFWDAKFASVPFVPFRMIKERTVIAACALSILDFFHYSCFTIFFPSYLQVAGAYSPGHASRIDNALRVSFQIASVLVGILMKYSKRSQIFVFIGVPLVVLGQGLQIYFTNVHGNGPASEVSFVTAKTLVGLGRAFYQTAAQVSIQALVRREDVAVVTGVYFAAMNFGSAIGTSVGGAIWNNLLPSKLKEYLPASGKSQAMAIFKSIAVARKYEQGTPMRLAIDKSYRETQQILAIAATAALAPMLLIMFALKTVDLSKEQLTDGDKSSTELDSTIAKRDLK